MKPLVRLRHGLVAVSVLLLGLLVLAACDKAKQESSLPPPPVPPSTAARPYTPAEPVSIAASSTSPMPTRPLVEIIGGSGAVVGRAPVARPTATESVDGVSLNFVNADLKDIIRAVLGDILKENYIIDPRVQGIATLETSRPIDRTSVLPVLETMLRTNGLAITRSAGVLNVVPMSEALKAGGSVRAPSEPGSVEYGVQVIPLRYVGAAEMEQILRAMAPGDILVRSVPGRNVLAIGGSRQDIRNVRDLIDVFDVSVLAGTAFALLSPRYVEARVLARELDQIFGLERSGAYQPVRFLAIERLNLVIAIARQARSLDEVSRWTERLDQSAESAEERVYIYNVQSGRAVDLAASLNALFASRDAGRGPGRSVLAPGTPITFGSSDVAGRTGLDSPPTTPSGIYTGTTVGGRTVVNVVQPPGSINMQPGQLPGAPVETGPATAPLAGDIPSLSSSPSSGAASAASERPAGPRVIADDKTNSLLVLATLQDWRRIEATLAKLDVAPMQVLIEAMIAEVTLTDQLRYGVQWFFQNNRSFGVLTQAASATVNPVLPGFSTVFQSGADVRVVLSALESVTRVNVVSAPQLMVLNNQTASLQVGDQVPIATQQAISVTNPDAPIVNTIQLRDTGVILRVTPRVNDGGLVLMDIVQEVSEVARTTTSGIDSPTIQQRKIGSTVSVQSGETVALGGLIRDRRTTGNSGVPLLKDIPLLGNLFKTTDNSDTRTELLVLITPKAVRSPTDLRRVTDELRGRMKGLRLDSFGQE